jgi:hypothetical protein
VTTQVHTAVTSKKAADAEVKAGKIATASGDGQTTTERKGTFRVITLAGNVLAALNAEENAPAIAELIKYGDSARVVTTIARTEDYSDTRTGKFTVSLGATYNAYSGKVGGGADSTSNRTLSNGTIFAYEISRICWTRNSAGRVIIGELMPDQPGVDPSCPKGMFPDPSKLK